MTVSMRVMSAGSGYKYLLRSVVHADGDLTAADALTRYYANPGTPPGRWLGKGVAQLGADGARIGVGDQVTEQQLARLLGTGHDPVTGQPLGRAYQQFATVPERIAARIEALPADLTDEERGSAAARVEAEEGKAGPKSAVAGFDLTFSVPKSVSVLWALADAGTQTLIVAAHHAAMGEVIDFLEREVAATRTGSGGICQEDVHGLIVTAYDHYDSRSNDPQLHTHAVVSNKVKTVSDGLWRSLDSRALHRALVAASEQYDALLMDRLSGTFGLSWELRERGRERNPQWEVAGIGEELIEEFSTRSHAINQAKERLITQYIATHDRRPSKTTVIKLRAQATLQTRPEKQIHSLADLTTGWRARAARVLSSLGASDGDPVALARSLTSPQVARDFAADEVPADAIERAAAATFHTVAARKTTFTHWNLWAEANRQTMGWRLQTAADREQVIAAIVAQAEAHAVALTPPGVAVTPASLQREDGTSRLRPRHHILFTSTQALDAEDRLLTLSADPTAARLDPRTVPKAVGRNGRLLSPQQRHAVQQFVASGRRVDLLVGPAGAGKTTTLRALRRTWTARFGKASVVALAPSAVAASVLSRELRLRAENTAKWLHEHDHGRAAFAKNQLVIIDESTLADTATLDQITGLAAAAGAKVVLVGDPAQLQSVDAGGAFDLLVERRRTAAGDSSTAVAELIEVHRFANPWEKTASLQLRDGDTDVIDLYDQHGRLRGGETETMIDDAYAAWQHDLTGGKATLLIAEASETVRELNQRARADRVLAGQTDAGRAVRLVDGLEASAGDLVITRQNRRRLTTVRDLVTGGFVRNGDRWQVTAVHRDGSLDVRRVDVDGTKRLADTVTLPAAYVAAHLDLGYAVTAHRAQGMTVDTTHALVTATTTRENLYVALTRGREGNFAYIAADRPDANHVGPDETVTYQAILYGVLQHRGAELSAHQAAEAEHETWTGRARLIAEYDHLADVAQRPRWTRVVAAALVAGGFTIDEARAHLQPGSGKLGGGAGHDTSRATAFDALRRELRRAEAYGWDAERLVWAAASRRTLLDVENPCAALHARLRRATKDPVRGHEPQLVAGETPAVIGPVPTHYRKALDQRAALLAPLLVRPLDVPSPRHGTGPAL
ncbi:MobF family relaxase [Myceligenerans xiligouense]|uniref:Conjugative relaxase-like TrwC/TraI family protein n=1 Tax=Myceligenerans xiligouense TaxID=253184 RepID=A0A3N4ZNR2_9MICO|nr:MobF family relaxase [Myceligenerans xiligouense]RPF21501.1 conjugative relaxase-like TrwC/TraI family protein [Myceligenerans xiligouense]